MSNNKVRIYTHSFASAGSKALADSLGCKRVKNKKPLSSVENIVNWGCTTTPAWASNKNYKWLNHPSVIDTFSDKLKFFKKFKNNIYGLIPSYFDESGIKSAENVLYKGYALLARDVLNGHGGEGIKIIANTDDLRNSSASLFTKYIAFRTEYRINLVIIDNVVTVISAQVKKKQNGWRDNPNFSSIIKSEHTGWKFCAIGVSDLPYDLLSNTSTMAKMMHHQTNGKFNFGGFDIGVTSGGLTKLIEVNTAPGLGSVNTTGYTEVINKWSSDN